MNGATYLDFDKAQQTGLKLIRTQQNPTAGLLIVVGINLGLRISDLLSLTYGELRKDSIQIIEGKTKKKRKLTMNDNIKTAIKYFDEAAFNDSFHAFRSQKATVYSNKHVNRLLSQYFKGDRVSSHSLRKTFGRRVWDNNNQSESALMYLSEIFAHKDIATTRKYLGIRQEQIDDIYKNL
jgi:integrase